MFSTVAHKAQKRVTDALKLELKVVGCESPSVVAENSTQVLSGLCRYCAHVYIIHTQIKLHIHNLKS